VIVISRSGVAADSSLPVTYTASGFQRTFVLSCLDQTKVKSFVDRPLGLQVVGVPRISRHEDRKIVSPSTDSQDFLYYWQMKLYICQP